MRTAKLRQQHGVPFQRLPDYLAARTNDQQQQIAEAYLAVLGRQPTAFELAVACDFLSHQTERYTNRKKTENEQTDSIVSRNGALVDYCLVLLNSAEFLYVD